MNEEKSCWTCGHFLIGGGCCIAGCGSGYWIKVDVDHTCDKWVEEGTKGTVTDFE